ncbi:MAG: hypothetical protein BMS9Abin18_0467 [Zetaproteobacteria bacterium]|nr:MAG: hypothetical protein BMS9Abin18_0467 [Zetaproteobacteria bacterium]
MIYREAAICHHCNTVQDGVELVQAKAETARTVLGNRKGGKRQAFSGNGSSNLRHCFDCAGRGHCYMVYAIPIIFPIFGVE